MERSVEGAFGRPCRIYREVASTNDVAREWAKAGAPEGAVVIAHHQTGGRGRRGRTWLSRPGRGILFSVVLRPQAEARSGLLPIALGVGCVEAVRSLGIDARNKWPNDVVVHAKKLAGILVETETNGAGSSAAIAGVGINYELDEGDLPEEIATRATSIASECTTVGRVAPTRMEVLVRVLDEISSAYALLERRADEILARARDRSALLGSDVEVHLPGGSTFVGRAVDLASDGGLIVHGDDGERVIHSGDVVSLRAGA